MGSALLLLVIYFDHRRCFLLTFFGGCWFFVLWISFVGYFFTPWGVGAVVPVHSGLQDLQGCLRFVVVRLAEFWTQLEVLVGGARTFFFGGAPLLPLRECWYSIWLFETSGISGLV